MPKKYKVLITGSSGMLGVDLSRELSGDYRLAGCDVAVKPPAAGFVKCDITDRGEVDRVIRRARPDVVVHAAAYTDVDGCEKDPKLAYRVNALGSRNVALACRRYGALLIAISTDFVFSGRKKTPYVETDKTGPISVYGDSKLKGEDAIRKTLKEHYIIRTSWLYGRHGKNFVDTIVAKAKTEKVLRVVHDQTGSPTYTVDLSRALHALIDSFFHMSGKRRAASGEIRSASGERRAANFGTYHFSDHGSTTWFSYAKKILKLAGQKTKVLPISSRDLARPAQRPAMSAMDCSKFTRITGYKPRAWERALKDYLS